MTAGTGTGDISSAKIAKRGEQSLPELRVDRARAVQLRGPAAAKMLGQLDGAVKSGIGIGRQVRPQDVFALVPSDELVRGIKDGTLRVATSKKGDASRLVKHVKSGKIAGHQRLTRVAKQVPVKAIAGAGLSAVSFAVEQKQLAEISARLDAIADGVEELKHLHYNDRAGTVATTEQLAAQARETGERTGRVPDHLLHDLRTWRSNAQREFNAAVITVDRHVKAYADRPLMSDKAEKELRESLASLVMTMDGLGRAGSTLASIPYPSAQLLEEARDDETYRLNQPSRP